MATKKVFTSLEFQSGAKLLKAKIDPQAAGDLSGADPSFGASAGQLAYGDDTNLYLGVGAEWKKLYRVGKAISTGEIITSTKTGAAPFDVSSSTMVDGLNVQYLNGSEKSNALGNNSIPVRDTNNLFHVGSATANPTENTHVTNKRYVDSVAQGLTIIDPAYLATAAALPACTYDNGTSDDGVGATLTGNANGALTIDGSAVSSSQRIVVKDQSTAAQNGIYTVTNAGSGSAAFVLTRATDYDTPAEINDGDFIFIQQGTDNANRGFVQTDNTWSTAGTMGSSNIAWTQFSGAGQISVTSTSGTGTPSSTAGPLIKAGDTIDFGYNENIFNLDSNKNLHLKPAGIGGDRLQNNSVTPTQLQDTGSFTMGGLTIDTSNPSIILDKTETGWGSLRFYKAGSQVSYIQLDGSEEMIYYQPSGLGHQFYAGGAAALKVNYDGSIGIGADAISPSGTLHISTARYGGNIITGDNADFSVADEAAAYAVKYNWGPYGSNTLAISNEQLVITYVDHSSLGYSNLTPTTIGRKYKAQIDVKYTGSGSAVLLQLWNGTSMVTVATLTTSLATYTATFERVASSPYWKFQAASGQSVTIDNLSLVEDSLASATGSDFAVADDLVINNGLTQAGMTLLGSGGARIHFGESGKEAHSRIIGTYDSNKDSSLFFAASNDGTAATVMTLFGNDKSAKFEGGVGIGALAGALALNIKTPAGGDALKIVDRNSSDVILSLSYGSATDEGLLDILKDNASKVRLRGNATSYFNGGNVAIGGTTADAKLQIDYGANPDDTSVDLLRLGSTVGSGYEEEFRIKWYSGTGDLAYIGGSHTDATAGNDKAYLAFGTRTSDVVSERLRIDHDGTQDHKANSIVNSATVAGLQDGACYDFDGSDDWIDAGSGSGIDDLDKITISAWVKFESWGESNAGRIVSKTSTANTAGWTLYANNSGRIGLIDDWTTTDGQYITVGPVVQLNKWYHIAVSYDRATAAQAPTFYVNGTVATYDSASSQNSAGSAVSDAGSPLLVGARRINSTSVDREFDGQIRDVKIFPSALDAADIRKLYSGENPKKNTNAPAFSDLNGEDWSGASGGTAPTGWTEGSDGTFSVTASELTITRNADNPYIYKTFTVTSGDVYKISYRLKNVNASSIRVGIGSTAVGTQLGFTDQSSTSYVTHEKIVTATSTTLSVYVQAITSTAGQNGLIDFLRIESVGTLVDFTPQSASSSKWRNEALLGLYDGTVNNATLSQGNSYWNNIKQDGQSVELSDTFEVTGANENINFKLGAPHNTITQRGWLQLSNATNNTTVYTNAGASNGEFGIHTFKQSKGDGTDARSILTLGETASTNVKVHGKLGVGGAASDCQLRVAGSSEFENTIFIGTHDGQRGLLSWSSDFDSGVGSAHSHFVIQGSATQLGGLYFKTRNSSGNVDAGVVSADGNWAIGGTAAAQKFQVNGNIQLTNTAQTSSNFATNNQSIIFGDEQTGTSARHQASINAVREAWSNSPCKLTFKTSADVNSATTKLEIASDGTQDHQGNRIVNSQTVNDSWRSSEPSLSLDGSNDFVNIPHSSAVNFNKTTPFTLSVWVKPDPNPINTTSSAIIEKWTGGGGYPFVIRMTPSGASKGQFQLAQYISGSGNAASVSTSSTIEPYADSLDRWNHIVGINTGTHLQIYLNGVKHDEIAVVSNDVDLSNDHAIGIGARNVAGSANYHHRGEIKDFRIHNRALGADEIKGLYNGESTPWVYADAGAELISNGTFSDTSSWTLHQGTNATTSFGSGVLTISNSSSSTAFTGADQSITVVKDKIYRLKLDVTVNNGAIYVKDNSSNTTLFYATEELSGGQEYPVTDSTVTGKTYYFKALASGTFTLRISRSTANGNTISVNVDNVSIQQIGEVAAYTPQSINDKWYDTTSNANHGTITGATTVGNTKHLGPLHIKGKTTAGIILENTTNAQDANIDYYNNVGGVQSRIAYAEGAGAFTFVPNVGGLPSGTLRLEHGNASGGAVTATSASSTNLKQVARVEGNQVTWPNATASTVAFRIDHGLGVDAPIVQVYEDAAPYGLVDVEVRQGDWIGADFGAVGTEQGASESAKDANRIRYVTVVMAANPGNATKWNYRVTG
jgi:hypothetical protein